MHHYGRLSSWAGFYELHDQLFPHLQKCREADADIVAAEKALSAGEEGTVSSTVSDAKEEHDLANALRKAAGAYYLGLDE